MMQLWVVIATIDFEFLISSGELHEHRNYPDHYHVV